ncbi:MAG: hypothetical protein JKY37_05170 [Nannocystaceae bacterium]|nr:hypothetical protein [Nannocystaceae bacterium]
MKRPLSFGCILIASCGSATVASRSDPQAVPTATSHAAQRSTSVASESPPGDSPSARAGAAPVERAGSSASPSPPPTAWSSFPMASNCQAKLALTEEVTRLLTKAAAHATRSQACVDGPGIRVAATDILVCPAASDDGDTVVSVYYRMARYPEGDSRGCGDSGRECDHLTPSIAEHHTTLSFEHNTKAQARLRTPDSVPGMGADATPLSAAHDGGCYGPSAAFAPRWVTP